MKILLFLLYSIIAIGTTATRSGAAISSNSETVQPRRLSQKAALRIGTKKPFRIQQERKSNSQCGNGKLKKRGQCLSTSDPSGRPGARQAGAQTALPPGMDMEMIVTAHARGQRAIAEMQNTAAQQSTSSSQQNYQQKITMLADDGARVRAIAGEKGVRDMGPWHRTSQDSRAPRPLTVSKEHPRNVIGQAYSNFGGKTYGSVRAAEIRADVATALQGEASVKIEDPSREKYPSGRHIETVRGETSKIFRATGTSEQPAKLTVFTKDQGVGQFEGASNQGAEALDHVSGQNRHRLPDGHVGLPALVTGSWSSRERGGGDIARG